MIHAKKSLGQNFLVDTGVARRIVDSAKLTENDIVLEIGPGQGALTRLLLETGARVIAVEIDQRCADLLTEQLESFDKFSLIRADILKLDIESLLTEAKIDTCQRIRVIANLPYNISSPVIAHLLASHAHIADMTVMLQKEVVDRIASGPDSKDYTRYRYLFNTSLLSKKCSTSCPARLDLSQKLCQPLFVLLFAINRRSV